MTEGPYSQVCQYMDRLLDDLRSAAPKALKKWDQDAIHEARVTTRRLKAVTDLLSPVTTEEHRKPFIKGLRTLRRRLGPLRDLDVMLDHLQEPRYGKAHGAAVHWVSRQLKEERNTQRKKLSGKALPARVLGRLGSWWGLREEICEGNHALTLPALLAESLHQQLASFSQHAQMLKSNSQVPLDQRQADDPHALRIAGKLLRYTLEVAGVLGNTLPVPVIAHFKQMQEALGQWHDSVVLSQKVMRLALDEEVGCHDRGLYEQLHDLSGMLWRQAEHHLKRFSAFWDQQGEEVSATIRQAFPLPEVVEPVVPASEQAAPQSLENPPPPPTLGFVAA